jgi:hypothetical protein
MSKHTFLLVLGQNPQMAHSPLLSAGAVEVEGARMLAGVLAVVEAAHTQK